LKIFVRSKAGRGLGFKEFGGVEPGFHVETYL
jgi:hypothetical protein